MQTITITITSPQISNIILKRSNTEVSDVTSNLTRLLKIIQPKEAQKQ